MLKRAPYVALALTLVAAAAAPAEDRLLWSFDTGG